jgi:hypothetical protein
MFIVKEKSFERKRNLLENKRQTLEEMPAASLDSFPSDLVFEITIFLSHVAFTLTRLESQSNHQCSFCSDQVSRT